MFAFAGQVHSTKRFDWQTMIVSITLQNLYRIYREQGLSLRLKRPDHNKSAEHRQPQELYPNHIQS
jgi:hypothetical protein